MNTNGARNMIASAIRIEWSAMVISSLLRRTERGGRRAARSAGGAAAPAGSGWVAASIYLSPPA